MDERGKHTLTEILSQPAIWSDALEAVRAQTDSLKRFWEKNSFDQVIFTGCGSTHYLAHFAAVEFQAQVGCSARAFPGAELALFPEACLDPNANTLLVAISRSGETTETIAANRIFRERYKGKTLVVTCYSESTLAAETDMLIAIDSAREESIAQTRSFSSMALSVQAITALLAGHDVNLSVLPAVASRLLNDYRALARDLGEDPEIERFFFLGSHVLYGLACEAMLKMKEMSLSYSEAYHVLEFRHGPMSMVDERALVVGLLTDQAYGNELAVLRDMHARGARILAISEAPDAQARALGQVVALQTGLPLWARAISYLPVLQLMAFHRAIFNQQDPDQPANLQAVIVLDPLV